jgi:hypothetical protein
LKRLEARFPSELIVIGVHAAKFDNEKATENIRQVIRRYEISHPVANAEFRIWRAYTVRAWPSRVIIDSGHEARIDRPRSKTPHLHSRRGSPSALTRCSWRMRSRTSSARSSCRR